MVRRSLVAAVFLLPAVPAQAQVSPFIIDQNRTDRTLPAPAPHQAPVAPAQPDDKLAAVTPFQLTGIRVEGTSLAPALLGEATRAFVGKTMDAAAIRAVAAAVSAAYAGQGDIALYTVTVPAQDFAGGVLLLRVTEGFISHVDLAGDTAHAARIAEMASRLTLEKPLRRSTLERYLSLIRDQPGVTVDAQLLQADAPGATRLVLTIHQKDHALALSLNDGGNSLLGKVQGQADLSFYNLLRDGEETKLSFGTSTIFSRYQSYSISDSQALDADGTRAVLSYAYLRTNIAPAAIRGHAQSLQLAASYPLIRAYDESLLLGGDIDGLDSTNALFGQYFASEHVRALRGLANYGRTDPVSALALGVSVSQGLDGLGARVAVPAETPDFHKLGLQARYNHLLGEDWVVRLAGTAQLAADRLPISELFSLGGGPDFGRAYLQSAALGDSGVAGSLELSYKIKALPGFLQGSEVFAFADTGSTWLRARPASAAISYHLTSAGGGFRLPVGDKTKLEIQAADAVSTNAPATRAGDWRFLFALTMRE